MDKERLVIDIYSNFKYQDFYKLKKSLPQVFHHFLQIPRLKRKSFKDIFRRGYFLSDNSDLFGALTFIIQNNAEDINNYIALKEKLDIATLYGNYEEAYSLLKHIDSEICISMIGSFYMIRLLRLDKGIGPCTEAYNDIHGQNNTLAYLCNITFKSSSIDMPFDHEIDLFYDAISGSHMLRDFATAFAYPYKDIGGDQWLKLLTNTSLIDLYEGFLLHLFKLSTERLKTDPLKSLIADLIKCINDKRLSRLYQLITEGLSNPDLEDLSVESAVVEEYYKGNYEVVINAGGDFLKSGNFNSTIFDLVARSFRKLDFFPDIFPDNSLAQKLLYFHFTSLENNSLKQMSNTLSKNIAMAWYAIPALRHLLTLWNGIDKCKNSGFYNDFWRYSPIPEIRDSAFFNSRIAASAYLSRTKSCKGESSQIEVFSNKLPDFYNLSNILIDGIKVEDIDLLTGLLAEGQIFSGLTPNIVSIIFAFLWDKGKHEDAIHLYVSHKLSNPYDKVFIDYKKVLGILTDEMDDTFINQMELAAFYCMIKADAYKRYLAYKRHLIKNGINKASDIEDISDPLVKFFIGKVVDKNVLYLHVTKFKPEEADAERILLCKKMLSLEEDKAFADEITNIIKEHEIRALSRQVNDSKIHVDVQPIINEQLETGRLIFSIYKKVDDNIEVIEWKNFQVYYNMMFNERDEENFTSNENILQKYKTILVRQMFCWIRDKFLFDPRYGLDKYLSARIRHGALITQLRNKFLSSGIVTNRQEGGAYAFNKKWTNDNPVYDLDDLSSSSINSTLLDFTEWIDENLIEIKDEFIQIRTESNNFKTRGLFNFSTDAMGSMLKNLENKSFESFEEFTKDTIDILWLRTKQVLEEIRRFFEGFQGRVLDKMNELNVRLGFLMKPFPDLARDFKDSFLSCHTNFQNDISIVSGWFKPELSNVRNFTLSQAVNTSFAVINKVNQDKLSFNSIVIEDDRDYNGDFFNNFHDVFHDMMNNILDYELKRPYLAGKSSIEILRDGDSVVITVSNPLDPADLMAIENVLKEQKDFPALIEKGKTRKEKNSGCVKIYSTVMYSLRGKSYENSIVENRFVSKIVINTKPLEFDEDTDSGR